MLPLGSKGTIELRGQVRPCVQLPLSATACFLSNRYYLP